jgi:hypothetical protein
VQTMAAVEGICESLLYFCRKKDNPVDSNSEVQNRSINMAVFPEHSMLLRLSISLPSLFVTVSV